MVTNYHDVECASEANTQPNNGRTYPDRLIGISPSHDLAELKIDVKMDLPSAVPVGTSDDLQVGQSNSSN
ncbi:hypothetical protein [Colwellia sp. KU-HH00111]|uniref:hypothetical protein n=1 Tax=Colwellia sp. KU-HH00111 TaxID=3127652 RepID=UPI0033654A12